MKSKLQTVFSFRADLLKNRREVYCATKKRSGVIFDKCCFYLGLAIFLINYVQDENAEDRLWILAAARVWV